MQPRVIQEERGRPRGAFCRWRYATQGSNRLVVEIHSVALSPLTSMVTGTRSDTCPSLFMAEKSMFRDHGPEVISQRQRQHVETERHILGAPREQLDDHVAQQAAGNP